jgi:mutator protein MutT
MSQQPYWKFLRAHVGHAKVFLPAAVAAVVDDEGRVLLHRRGDEPGEMWSFPGGSVNIGESAAEALVREVREEVGLEVEPGEVIGVYTSPEFDWSYANGDQIQAFMVLIRCSIVGGDIQVDGQEATDAAFFGPDDPLPPMRRCCIVKAHDTFAFDGRVFLR